MTFRDEYTRLYSQAEPSPSLINRTLLAARSHSHLTLRRSGAVLLSCILSLGLATSALAAASADFNQWLYRYLPSAAMFFRPVNAVCEDQGIRMEVQAIHVEDNTADVFITLTDLEGTKLDSTVDLFDSYSIDTPGSASAGCIFSDWNEESRQATFRIHYRSEHPIRQDKLTFSLSRLLTGKKKTSVPVADFHPVLSESAVFDPGDRFRGWGSSDEHTANRVKDTGMLDLPEAGTEVIPGVYYLGCSWVEGLLHVQLRYTDITRTDNNGFVWLEDADGRQVHTVASLSAWASNHSDSLEEYVFALTPEQVEGMTLMGKFFTCENLITGDWSVTFPLQETPEA